MEFVNIPADNSNKPAVRYRLDIDYLSKNYDNWVMEVSSPIYDITEGTSKYLDAIKEKCIDNSEIPVRVHLWEYNWNGNKLDPITIMKNYA
jgi:hypothetical protein